MAVGNFPKNENIALMAELLKCGTNINLWCYGFDGHLMGTDASALVLDKFFENSGNKGYMLDHFGQYSAPLIMGGQMGLMWCAVYEYHDGAPHSVYVLGPVFNSDISAKTMEQSARIFQVGLSWREGFLALMSSLPVVSSVLFFQYALMLHYCVNGEKLNRSDLHFQKWTPSKSAPQEPEEQHDRMRVWLAERALLNMVREGNLNYQSVLAKANLMSNGVRAGENNPTLQAMVSCTSFTSLCVREAIQAGISPDTAYRVGDSYIESMVECKSITELRSINHAMYEDFILRVHKHRTNPKVSTQIQACRDYIESHTDQPLTLEILSKQAGYSEYHLSRKFKQEMGVSISTYIRYARVEQAKLLLTTTSEPISKIAIDLQFSSASHFSQVFGEIAGEKPLEYRKKHLNAVIPRDEDAQAL